MTRATSALERHTRRVAPSSAGRGALKPSGGLDVAARTNSHRRGFAEQVLGEDASA
jgi:hypothetical protein